MTRRELSLKKLRAKPPGERQRLTIGRIYIDFSTVTKPSDFRMRPTNPTIAYYWSEEYRKRRS